VRPSGSASEPVVHPRRRSRADRLPGRGAGRDAPGTLALVNQRAPILQQAILEVTEVAEHLAGVAGLIAEAQVQLGLADELVEDDEIVDERAACPVDAEAEHRQRRLDEAEDCQDAGDQAAREPQVDQEVVVPAVDGVARV